jgi:hypothetical protein
MEAARSIAAASPTELPPTIAAVIGIIG